MGNCRHRIDHNGRVQVLCVRTSATGLNYRAVLGRAQVTATTDVMAGD